MLQVGVMGGGVVCVVAALLQPPVIFEGSSPKGVFGRSAGIAEATAGPVAMPSSVALPSVMAASEEPSGVVKTATRHTMNKERSVAALMRMDRLVRLKFMVFCSFERVVMLRSIVMAYPRKSARHCESYGISKK